jgi:hypothetical protein
MLIAAALAAALAAPCSAGVVEVPLAAAPSTFPGDYVHSVSLSLTAQPFYASTFLNNFQAQLNAVAALPSAPAAAAYLEKAAGGAAGFAALRASVGSSEIPAEKAAALLIANSLVRPDQFRAVMDGLETIKPGMGRHAATILSSTSGPGNGKLIAALRAAGERRPRPEGLTYGPDGRWATMFDGSPARRLDDDAVQAGPRDDAARARLPALTKPR